MSRSYCKSLGCYREYGKSSVDRYIRSQNRLCIHREMRSSNVGDIVFPIPKESIEASGHGHHPPISKKEIRDNYFLEIRNILNGYSSRNEEPCDEFFLEICTRIKGFIPDDGRKYEYDWLNVREIRKIIKTWPGNPLEVLQYLTHYSFIEKAVQLNAKLSARK